MIPKVIHYCWFGGNPKPDIINKCIESWKKFCPDWEIKEWNETNFDINEVPYMKEAYDSKKWAFVSDVARLLVIYKYGGIYMDTDVELLSTLYSLTDYEAFFAFESERNINTGLGFGAVKHHKIIKAMLDYYNDRHFTIDGKVDLTPCPAGNTSALTKCCEKFIRDGSTQTIDNVCILSCSDYFKFARHHATATWTEGNQSYIRKPYRPTRLKQFLRQTKRFDYIEKHFGKKALKMYTFFAYDFLEFGLFYLIKRSFRRKH